MKSRLRPPDHDSQTPPSSDSYSRRASDTADADVQATPTSDTGNDANSTGTNGSKTPSATSENVGHATAKKPQTARSGPPLPHHIRGRWLTGLILAATVAAIGFVVWHSFFRYGAFGVVTGRVVDVSPPWPGTLSAVLVRAGDTVRQNDVLAIVEDFEITSSIQRHRDALLSAQAQLDAEVARLALSAQQKRDGDQEVLADYYELQGEYLVEQSHLEDLEARLTRYERLADSQAVTEDELQSLKFARIGLQAKVQQLEQAIAARQSRVEMTQVPVQMEAQLKPHLAEIRKQQSEIARLREKQSLGAIRAPVTGRVLQLHLFSGEYVEPRQPLMELLEERSEELVVYVRQGRAKRYRTGDTVRVRMVSSGTLIPCIVDRLGYRHADPTPNVMTRYRSGESTVPVYLKPPQELPEGVTLRLGAEVRVPFLESVR